MQRQGIEVVGVCYHSEFSHPQLISGASEAAKQLQIELRFEPDYDLPSLINRPKFGFAEGMAPCLDCRSRMVARLQEKLAPLGASFLISGEVVGQRPSSLRSRDLETIAYHGNAENSLLRPLSAKLLLPTLPEVEGWVDRNQLFDWQGKARKEQIKLAREWGLSEPKGHVAGCALLEPTYAARLKKLLEIEASPDRDSLRSLRIGRHFWRNQAHLVVARNSDEGTQISRLWVAIGSSVTLKPANFRGPIALLSGKIDDATIADAANVIAQFGKDIVSHQSSVELVGWSETSVLITKEPERGSREFHGFTE